MRTLVIGGLLSLVPAMALAFVVDFESAPASSGCLQHGFTLSTQGFTFSNAGGSNRLFGCDGTHAQLGSNGSNALLDDSGLSDFVMIENAGDRITLHSFAAGEVFVGDPTQNATSIAVAGFRDGSVVIQTGALPLDGIVDGPGGSADFQVFQLPSGFKNLEKVQIGAVTGGVNGHLFFIDDLSVTVVPEPGVGLPLALGFALCLLAPRTRRVWA